MRQILYLLFSFCLAFSFSISSFAATVTWDGGATDGLWTSPTNWDGDVLPGSSDDVIIDNGNTVNLNSATPQTIQSLVVSASTLILGANADLTIDGSDTNLNVIATGGEMTNNGDIHIMNGTVRGIRLFNGVTFTNNGTIDIAGTYTPEAINSQNGIFENHGDITITSSSARGMTTGNFTNHSGATIVISGTGDYGIVSSGNFTNDGSLTHTSIGNVRAVRNNDLFDNNGTLTLNTASGDAFFNNASGDILTNTGTVILNSSAGAAINNDAGAGGIVNTGGTIMAIGELQDVPTLAGTFAPGNSVGTTTTNGNLTLTGTLEIEVDDRTTYDQLNGAGTFDVSGGTFEFTFAGTTSNYANGDKFQIFSGFTTINLPSFTNNLGFTIVHNGGGEFEITAGGLLPVEIIDFSADVKNKDIILNWSTALEINNEGFEIQHLVIGRDWEMIDFIKGMGTSFEVNNYRFSHESPNSGINYYRLKQIDFDGEFEYSKTVSANLKSGDEEFSFSPNPAKSGGSLRLQKDSETLGIISVFNFAGRQILQTDLEEGISDFEISLTDLPAGVYMIRMDSGRAFTSKRLIIE